MKKSISEMTLKELVGHKIMLGLPGETLDDITKETIINYGISNVILFKRNIKDLDRLKALCDEIQDLVIKTTGYPAIIGVDEEGGCVNRLPNTAMIMPAPMGIAATGSPENGEKLAVLSAKQLKSLGINMSFVPDCDINSNPANPIIGGRSYGDTPGQVTEYVRAINNAYKSENFLISAKHFPGHGDTDMDTHLSLPVIHKSFEELSEFELIPFKELIRDGVSSIMTTHILFPAIEKENVPGTMSRTIITDILRNRLGYEGLIVSDCMEMDAIKKYYGTVEGCGKAAMAGVDIMLVCHTPELQRGATKEMLRLLEEGKYSKAELLDSVKRIIEYKEKYAITSTQTFDIEKAKEEALNIRKKTFVLIGGDIPAPGDHPFFVGCEDFRSANVSDAPEDKISFPEYMSKALSGDYLITSQDPDINEIQKALSLAKNHSAIFVNTFNAHMFKGQARLVNALGSLGIPILAVTMRDPYDLCFIDKDIPSVLAWDYTPANLAALLPVISGKERPTGNVPITLNREFCTIEPFKKEDVKGVSETIANTYRISNAGDYTSEYIERDLEKLKPEDILRISETAHFYVAKRGERIIACAGIKPYNDSLDESILTAVFVLPEYQGFDIGTKLISAIEKDPLYTRAKRIEVPASITAYKFYKKLGFAHKNNIEAPDETHRYPMEKYNNVKTD